MAVTKHVSVRKAAATYNKASLITFGGKKFTVIVTAKVAIFFPLLLAYLPHYFLKGEEKKKNLPYKL